MAADRDLPERADLDTLDESATTVPDRPAGLQSALPSTTARLLAFLGIVVGGVCGGLIGYAFADLQCEGECGTQMGLSGLTGALIGAGGVAIVAVLALRAMGEWKSIQKRNEGA